MDRIEIAPTNIQLLSRTQVGTNVLIDDDVQGIARDLREIDDSLKLEFDPDAEVFIVYQVVAEPDGSVSDKLVTTWSIELNGPLDKRLVHRMREISADGYDYVAE